MSVTRILSLDGGGVRGLCEIVMLAELERLLRVRTHDTTAKIVDYFDLIAGTSAGAIVGGLLVLPDLPSFIASSTSLTPYKTRFDVKQIQDFFIQQAPLLFTASKTSLFGWRAAEYDDTIFNNTLRSLAGDIKLSQLTPRVIFPSWDYPTGKPILMTNLQQHPVTPQPRDDFLLADSVRASAAAPSYFLPATVQATSGTSYTLGDGGLYANNPSMLALVESYPTTINTTFLLSLSTGATTPTYQDTTKWGKLDWIRPVISIQTSASSALVDRELTHLFAVNNSPSNYIRLSPALPTASQALDDPSPSNLQKLINDTTSYLQTNQHILQQILDWLLSPPNPSRLTRRYIPH